MNVNISTLFILLCIFFAVPGAQCQEDRVIAAWEKRYDPSEKMLTAHLTEWNYHTDAVKADYHEVRGSLYYAAALLDLGGKINRERATGIIEKIISLQDTSSSSRSRGVWPYYLEEPLAGKKSPVDFNWADFNTVTLIDIYLAHKNDLPVPLQQKIKQAVILAANSIRQRDVKPDYTNIAIMGSYVTYMTSDLFGLNDMKQYATGRIATFYDYTLAKNGFSEYNSPTYTLTALEELERMKRNISDPAIRKMTDSLYAIAWKIIATHYYAPAAQWAGPHSRSYSTLVRPSFYGLLNMASQGRIDTAYKYEGRDKRVKHRIPEWLMPYFTEPRFPRTETDTFENVKPEIVGTTFFTSRYVFSTANRSSLWNQRRPFLVYWGAPRSPHYLQLRFLHDGYDFSSASFYSAQQNNGALSCINFITNGGDKHISLDRIKDGKFRAKDLRLRFEFGNCNALNDIKLPAEIHQPFSVKLDKLDFTISAFATLFDDYTCYWEKGSDGKNSWIDLVVYAGREKEIDLAAMKKALIGWCFRVSDAQENNSFPGSSFSINEDEIEMKWNGLRLSASVKPTKQPPHL